MPMYETKDCLFQGLEIFLHYRQNCVSNGFGIARCNCRTSIHPLIHPFIHLSIRPSSTHPFPPASTPSPGRRKCLRPRDTETTSSSPQKRGNFLIGSSLWPIRNKFISGGPTLGWLGYKWGNGLALTLAEHTEKVSEGGFKLKVTRAVAQYWVMKKKRSIDGVNKRTTICINIADKNMSW